MHVLVVGAGIGGLAAALRLVRGGAEVTILEARANAGGLAGSVEASGLTFDAGPYILLDRPGLEWAFERLGLTLDALDLQRLEGVAYEVSWDDGRNLSIWSDVERSAREMAAIERGAGSRYVKMVKAMGKRYRQLQPMLRMSRPGLGAALRHGALSSLPFLLRSLGDVMNEARLPRRVVEAVTIWTHVSGQRLRDAPSPMAFVPALIHNYGAWRPRGGTASIARTLQAEAERAGVRFRFGTRVTAIATEGGAVKGVVTADGELVVADAVVSNHSAVGTYVDLLDSTPATTKARLQRLPLQSPGACAYIRARSSAGQPYLRFRLASDPRCVLLVVPPGGEGTARLILPIAYERARSMSRDEQLVLLRQALGEEWWREGLTDVEVLLERTPSDWGSEYMLYRDSMNVVMSAAMMRRGRIAHRSDLVRNLFLAGSSTHPGQWISFCAISGVLAAEELLGSR